MVNHLNHSYTKPDPSVIPICRELNKALFICITYLRCRDIMVKYTILIGYLSLTSEKYSPRQFGVRKGILGLQIIA